MKQQYEPIKKSKLEKFVDRYGKDWREMFIGSQIFPYYILNYGRLNKKITSNGNAF